MGLDMYIIKKSVAKGHDIRVVEELNEMMQFVNNYEKLIEQVKDNGSNLNPAQFWTVLGESPEEKRERLLREIPQYLTEHKENYEAALKQLTIENIILARSFSIDEVAYWRKANHIHKWFVDNIQDGEDDCEEYPLSLSQISKLLEVCHEVVTLSKSALNDHEKKSKYSELLPTQEGFFFGDTEYDDYYIGAVEDTVDQLTPLLKSELGDNEKYFYVSSW